MRSTTVSGAPADTLNVILSRSVNPIEIWKTVVLAFARSKSHVKSPKIYTLTMVLTPATILMVSLAACEQLAAQHQQIDTDSGLQSSRDGLWRPYVGEIADIAPQNAPETVVGFFEIDEGVLAEILASAEASDSAREAEAPEITLPMPGGGYASFRIEKSDVLSEELKAKYPQLRTFRGQGIDLPEATVRFESTATGFHAYVRSSLGTIYIDPWRDSELYALRHIPPDK